MEKDPVKISKNYIKSFFVFDLVAITPWAVLKPQYIFLRYIKLVKIHEFKRDFSKLILAMIDPFVAKSKQLNVVGLVNLLMAILLTSHFFAILWMVIGGNEHEKTGS